MAVLFLIENWAVKDGDLRGHQGVVHAALRLSVGLNNGALRSLKVEGANDTVFLSGAVAAPDVSGTNKSRGALAILLGLVGVASQWVVDAAVA